MPVKRASILAATGLLVAAGFVSHAVAGGRPLSTTLTGAQEVPPADPDGSGTASFTLNQGQGQICFTLTASNLAPTTAAHIHEASAGQNGPVVVTLTPPGPDGSSSGCVAAPAEVIKAIRQNPSDYYVNIHTTEFPGGAIRGQLSK